MTPRPQDQTGFSDEVVEVVDESGAVVGHATRSEVRRRNLRHRTVFIALVDEQRNLVVHRRASWKDVWPGRWDIAFGGLCRVGESWEEAAARELREEAGVCSPLTKLGEGTYEDDTTREIAAVFLARGAGPFTFRDGEVERVEFVPLDSLYAWSRGRLLCPDSVALVFPLLETLMAGSE